ncbi:mannose-1-phosphate guanylyltransferase/mannose-6-phosphate isomerase [Sphingosinicella humi]|uniref:mannose-1-phosphate guanylyltransferase n=1 Tax=Allosphingosinicella humi TaxID=2068657 RepID=A0A2U2J1A2_9SPHN|nr:mannose-1-phosphate guanylyltransferase/mannose-6-phosphate isomerase [Sphingosinicella humi]PWG02113.1 mannose-1-phosphate guanylyltransferase/mannose-6-phosphate isomerase [Sphingosinicella humi]
MASALIHPVILCGGAGQRLWPLSSPEQPKPLLPLVGNKSMLQLTADRVSDRTRYAAPIVVCGTLHARQVENQLVEAGAAPATMIVEPASRNTAPAIALAAASVAPETALLVMPSDHLVERAEPFRRAVDLALPAALDGRIVTFGIEPTRPENGYGYIRIGERLSEGVHVVDAFVEKPELERATAYLAEGGYSWNAGIFLFRAGDYLAALARHAPAIAVAAQSSLELARKDGIHIRPDPEAFGASPSLSIDYAVIEKTERAAVVPVEMGWSDIGSWDAVYEFSGKDAEGNALSGDVLALGTEGSLIHSDGPTVAAIGVRDLLILVSDGSVLVLPRGESQRVREIADLLAKRSPDANPGSR